MPLVWMPLVFAETVFTSSGGWATNMKSWCVNMAVSHALLSLDLSGQLNSMYNEYIAERPCLLPGAAVATETSARRRLHADADPAHGSSQDSRRMPGRRLKGVGAGTEEATYGVPQMTFDDFAGMFVVWLAVSIFIVAWAYVSYSEPFKKYAAKSQRPGDSVEALRPAPPSAAATGKWREQVEMKLERIQVGGLSRLACALFLRTFVCHPSPCDLPWPCMLLRIYPHLISPASSMYSSGHPRGPRAARRARRQHAGGRRHQARWCQVNERQAAKGQVWSAADKEEHDEQRRRRSGVAVWRCRRGGSRSVT